MIEISRETGEVTVLDYVTVHDAGRLLNPMLVDGQIRGGFAHGVGPALFERVVYDDDGNLLTGTFMDYLCPTGADLPPLRIAHLESPSPFTPLGAKGVGEGNTMSVPAAIANAVADAIGREDVELPLTAPRVWELLRVKPVAFRYERPESVEEAVSLLAEHGDEAKVLAGGQSLVPVLNMRLLRPSVVLDINRVLDLDNIARDNGAFRVGALVRQSDTRLLEVPLLRDCLPHVGHFVTRNRGTVCGSVAHADAAAELPLALTLLGGSVVAASARGRREIAAADFYVTHFTTHLGPDELVVETVWPADGDGWGYAFEELAQRHGDFALCMAGAAAGGSELRVAVGRRRRPADADRRRPRCAGRVRSRAGRAVRQSPRIGRVPPEPRARPRRPRRGPGQGGRDMIDVAVTVNDKSLPRAGRTEAAPVRLPPSHARPDWNARRLRARRLRRLHGPARRRFRPLVPPARGAGGRRRDRHGRRARRERRVEPAPGALSGSAMHCSAGFARRES